MVRTTNIPNRHPRALVLDSEAASLRDLRHSLEAQSFSVASASDGTRGLALLLDQLLDLDVLVMDADLPHRDARSFAKLIRRAGGEHDLAIVVVAHVACLALRSELRALGVDAVVDRADGPDAAAAAAHEAVTARMRRSGRFTERTAPVEPTPSAADEPWTVSVGRWAPLPA